MKILAATAGFDQKLESRAVYSAMALLAIAGAAVIYIFDPRVPGIYPVCPFFGLTGYHCAGCGTLRALHSLIHADIAGALGYNAFTVTALPFIAYSYLSGVKRVFMDRPLPGMFIPHRWIWALLAAIVSFWIIRNLPLHPFSVLAP